MKRLIRWAFRLIKGLDDSELGRRWTWHHFTTRSRAKAYWRTLTN